MPLYCPAHLTKTQWLHQRFWAGVSKQGEDDCWPWVKACVSDGYGTIAFNSDIKKATHRLSWEIHKGPIPKGMWVLHSCDNPPCCNPKHLFLGTHLDNMRDRMEKKRDNNKLGRIEVNAIMIDPRKQRDIAFDYKITQSMVSRIKRGNRRSSI